jgi:hypothetical protein
MNVELEISTLKEENRLLRNALSSDFDLDAWLDWKVEVNNHTKRIKYFECLSCADDAESMGASDVAKYLREYAESRFTKN